MNESGISPCGHRVLVLPDEVQEQTKTGVVVMTQVQRVKEEMAQIEGTIVAIGPGAWSEFGQPWACLGDRVIFAKYGGLIYDKQHTRDGKTYRLLNDLDIVAIVKK